MLMLARKQGTQSHVLQALPPFRTRSAPHKARAGIAGQCEVALAPTNQQLKARQHAKQIAQRRPSSTSLKTRLIPGNQADQTLSTWTLAGPALCPASIGSTATSDKHHAAQLPATKTLKPCLHLAYLGRLLRTTERTPNWSGGGT